MRPLGSILQPLLLLPFFSSVAVATPKEIQWSDCEIPNQTLPLQCGKLDVPLDYSDNTSNATLSLELTRVPALYKGENGKAKLGSILFNFGGPGASGVQDLAIYAQRLQAATGGQHDLINVTPRGTGSTLPFSCYTDPITRQYTERPLASNASDVALGQLWAEGQMFVDRCYALQNKTGNYLGTTFVARDLMNVVDALDEDGMLRYWGISYGTILGATIVAMFPDRMDKVIIDGVANPIEYYQNKEVELFTNMDDVFSGFCAGCIAAPESCPLAAKGLTASQLEEKIYGFIEEVKYNPLYLAGYVIDYSTVRSIIAYGLYFPSGWPKLSQDLHAMITRNATGMDAESPESASEAAAALANALPGIKCSDVLTHAEKLEDIAPVVRGREQMSRIAGDVAPGIPTRCSLWRMPAKERYRGDFRVTPKNPVLVIGNTYDPVTPLVSAQNVTERFDGSVLLQQDCYGHASVIQASLCTNRAIRSYFTRGELPKPGTICDVKVPLFSGSDGWDEVIEQLKADESEN